MKSVRLFTFDNHPSHELATYYQIWVGGLVRGRGHYVIKPETEEEDKALRKGFADTGYTHKEVEHIMNYIYKKL